MDVEVKKRYGSRITRAMLWSNIDVRKWANHQICDWASLKWRESQIGRGQELRWEVSSRKIRGLLKWIALKILKGLLTHLTKTWSFDELEIECETNGCSLLLELSDLFNSSTLVLKSLRLDVLAPLFEERSRIHSEPMTSKFAECLVKLVTASEPSNLCTNGDFSEVASQLATLGTQVEEFIPFELRHYDASFFNQCVCCSYPTEVYDSDDDLWRSIWVQSSLPWKFLGMRFSLILQGIQRSNLIELSVLRLVSKSLRSTST